LLKNAQKNPICRFWCEREVQTLFEALKIHHTILTNLDALGTDSTKTTYRCTVVVWKDERHKMEQILVVDTHRTRGRIKGCTKELNVANLEERQSGHSK